jgi:hypothetical protein
MTDPTPPLSGLSPVSGKTVITKFDGGLLSLTAALWPCARSSNAFALLERQF